MIAQLLFAVLSIGTLGLAASQFLRVYRNIQLGKAQKLSGDSAQRWKNVLLIALGQQKMFARPISAIMHLFVYLAFLITQIELIEIFIDGFTGNHRFFFHHGNDFVKGFYNFMISTIEVLSVLALVATFVFLSRRNLLRLPRFHKAEMKGWPTMDANNILIAEIVLVVCIFLMNTADMALHDEEGMNFIVSSMIYGIWDNVHSNESLKLISQIGWWGHIIVVFAFLAYLPYSKHLHILLAFPNTYFAPIKAAGQLENMPEIQKEVASFLDPNAAFAEVDPNAPMPKFGASDIFDLDRAHILAAYTCTECGRCTSSCPANQTGKLLSPRKIMMDIRDRADEVGKEIMANNTKFIREDLKGSTSQLTKENYDDGKSLFDYITVEELRACTTCNACIEACPVLIRPMDIIMELRRNLILEKSDSPEAWNSMFNAVENNAAPWAFSPDDRDKWITEINN
jgi:heterodisulfide reductase subunit C